MEGAERCESAHLTLKLCLEHLALQKIQGAMPRVGNELVSCATVPLTWDRGQKS